MKNKNSEFLTILVPIHVLDIDRKYITNMFESLSKQKDNDFNILVATFEDLKGQINNMNIYDLNISFVDLPEEIRNIPLPNYTEIVNFAVHSIETKLFSIVQYDDVLNENYVELVKRYNISYPSVSVFIPISLDFDGESFVRMCNEAVWNLNYTEKQGYFDFESLRNLMTASFVGAVYNTDLFVKNVGVKHSIKKYFEFEFFLRLLYQQAEIMVIPHFIIRHTVNREGSISSINSALPVLEQRFYQDVAKKEYYFTEDRKLLYEEQAQG